jgi:large subunit ribosomal protein L15
MVSVWEELKVRTKQSKKSKRVGRGDGSGKGNFSGRGHDGQQKRSGAKVKAFFDGGQRPITLRTPMIRGKRFRKHDSETRKVIVVNISDIDQSSTEIDLAALSMPKNGYKVKLLGDGELSRKITVHSHMFSASARTKIESAGGTCIVVE